MESQTGLAAKYGLAGVFVGVIFTFMIGVNGGFLMTKSNSEKKAHAAVLANEANICVAQISSGPNAQENLKSFKAMNFTQRDEFIEKGGWSRMPGATAGDGEVARQCAEQLAAIEDK